MTSQPEQQQQQNIEESSGQYTSEQFMATGKSELPAENMPLQPVLDRDDDAGSNQELEFSDQPAPAQTNYKEMPPQAAIQSENQTNVEVGYHQERELQATNTAGLQEQEGETGLDESPQRTPEGYLATSQMTYQQNDDLAIMGPDINNVQLHLQTLNKIRMVNEVDGDFSAAEHQLSQIVQIRERAESGLKMSLKAKHDREETQIEDQNRVDFDGFTALWDQKFLVYQQDAIQQMQSLRQKHAVQLEQLREYLEQTMTTQHKRTSDVLNLEKICQTLIKQKNYPEVTRVTKVIDELNKKEAAKFLKIRGDRIEIQINHLITKQEQEVNALDMKLNQGWAEVDKVRKREQQQMIQKFLNISNQLHINQGLEASKLTTVLKVKNYATTIVGKNNGAMRSNQYSLK